MARSGAQQMNSKASRAGRLGMVRLRTAPPRAEDDPGDRRLPRRGSLEGTDGRGNQCGMDQETPLPRKVCLPPASLPPWPSHPRVTPSQGEPCSGPLPKATGSQETRKEENETFPHQAGDARDAA